MNVYEAPLKDQKFVFKELADLGTITRLPSFEHATVDMMESVLDEASRFAAEVVGPSNAVGDQEGCQLKNGTVQVPTELLDAYLLFVQNGWQGLECPQDHGGMGMPTLLGAATTEMWHGANLALSLCPFLTSGAVIAIDSHASEQLKKSYLPKMVSGEWAGTMNLTEAQAGSDLATIRTQALPCGDHYKITGTKVFITWGDHEMTENIVHLVLARLPDAPEGTKGISLFLVPKYVVNDDGILGERNDVFVTSIEHKLGIHASPTCVVNFGENHGAVGYLVGEENAGLKCMFTMMNHARLGVGIEGLAISERSYQAARSYARERVQGRVPGTGEKARIVQHLDVRRMLMTMKSLVEAMRVIAYTTASVIDLSHHADEVETRSSARSRSALLTPIIKGWMTEVAQELTSIGVQIHGGSGFVEETGVAQYMRDARILTIYEGTTGIQANDLVVRKVLPDGGAAMRCVLAEIAELDQRLAKCGAELRRIRSAVASGRQRLEEATDWLLGNVRDEPTIAYSAAFNYLMLAGTVVGAWQMGRAAEVAHRMLDCEGADVAFLNAKITTAEFYSEHILPRSAAYLEAAKASVHVLTELPENQF